MPPKYSSDHTSFLGEGLAWTSELQRGLGGEERALLGFQDPEGPVVPGATLPPQRWVSLNLALMFLFLCISAYGYVSLLRVFHPCLSGGLWVPGTMCVRVCGCVVSLCLSLFLHLS